VLDDILMKAKRGNWRLMKTFWLLRLKNTFSKNQRMMIPTLMMSMEPRLEANLLVSIDSWHFHKILCCTIKNL
jgi:hypothetical protein